MAEMIRTIKREVFYNQGIVYRAPRATRWQDLQAYNDGSKV